VAWLTLHFSATELRHRLILLAVPAVAVFALFAAFGAGKPGEYGRFLIVPDVVLLIGLFVALRRVVADNPRRVQAGMVVLVTAVFGAMYWIGFVRDASGFNTRTGGVRPEMADVHSVAMYAEPAPYSLPPMDLFQAEWWLVPQGQTLDVDATIRIRDTGTRISWANKPFELRRRPAN
jgi:hypothetical protein